MRKSSDLVIYDQYKSLPCHERQKVMDTLVSEGIMSKPSVYFKMRTRTLTVLEARYVSELIKSIVDAREN